MFNEVKYIEEVCATDHEYDDDNYNYEISENRCDDMVIARNLSSTMSDSVSEKTCSSLENDIEAILHDHTTIINCLLSTPYQRSQPEIAVISQLLQSIPYFMCATGTELEYACQSAKLLTVSLENEIIIKKSSILYEWYFCLEGNLRRENGFTTVLVPGAFIGTDLWSEETLISDFDLFSNCNDCKLMVISKEDLKPVNQVNQLIIKTSDEDKSVIAVYEAYTNVSAKDDMGGYVLIKGTQDILISHLFSNPKWVSEEYVEDFFLTYKLFLNSTMNIQNEIANTLYSENEYAKDIFNIFIRWLSQSFPIFERSHNELLFIDKIINILKNQNNNNWLYILYDCCSNGAKVREIKDILSLKDYVMPVQIADQTLFYIHQFNDIEIGLHNGDIIIELDGHSFESITMEMIKSLSEDNKPITVSVKNDLLGYHENVIKDISLDSVSVHSTPSNTRYSRYSFDKMSDANSLSTNDSDNNSIVTNEKVINPHKRPSVIPAFFSNLQTGTVGRFFKNPKHYTKTIPSSNNRSNSDVSTRLENLHNGNRDLGGSSFSIARFSRRMKSKRQRCSIGSNPDLIKSFDDLDVSETNSITSYKRPVRIYLKETFISFAILCGIKTDLRFFHILIEPSTTVTEVIVRTLLKLNLASAKSNEFFLVEVKVTESSGMIHEKILHPNTSNLIDRLKNHCRFYLKHRSSVGESMILQSEADKMREEFKLPSFLEMPTKSLVIRIFLKSYKLLCKIQPEDLINHISNNKATLKYSKDSIPSETRIFEYMQLSDFYKYWVITEICSETNINNRALIIQHFINLALQAIYIGHIDLFFSLISGLDSVEVSKLCFTWDKVSKRDKKMLEKLKTTLNVSGNMRNLRILHQKIPSPFIPVTVLTIKDLTMLEETYSTYVSGTINGLQANKNLINFEKMKKMSRISRIFVNSTCSCVDDKSKPIRKHLSYCKMKWENYESLDRVLLHRLGNQSENHFQKLYSDSFTDRSSRKCSLSNLSVHSSSSESLSESGKMIEEKSHCQAFEQLMMIMKIERYLNTIEDRVVLDPQILSDMSVACEQNNHIEGMYEAKQKNSLKIPKISQSSKADTDNISDKAAEILGLKEKSKIHRYKKAT